MRDGYALRAVLPGGASTPFVPADAIDVLMDFDHMKQAGYGLGTGTALLVDDSVCPVGLCLNLVRFFAQESCGWCTPCWAGLPWTVDVLNDIEEGRGRPEHLDLLAEQMLVHGRADVLLRPRAERHASRWAPPSSSSATSSSATSPRAAAATARGRGRRARRRTAPPPTNGAPMQAPPPAAPPSPDRPRAACPALPQTGGADMATVAITIEGVRHEVDDTRNLLDICLSLGYDVPYFCWHPAMGSIGACRQCAVKLFWDDDDQKGEIVMACLTRPREGNRVAIDDDEAVRFRATIIELLMTSHPHDCPVCDEGGECHLQDMTVMTGHVYRRYDYRKRTFENHDLGPFVTHEMNRCIQCYRCLRFYVDYAGGHDFGAFGLRNEVYFGRLTDGALDSEFSGNLVEVCPVGVFDDKTFAAHYTRKWDLQTAPAVCAYCGHGCNTIAGERYGELRRVLNRFNGEVNGYFLCDRGRYAYQSVNGPERVRQPIVGLGGLSASELVRGLGARLESALGERRVAVGARPRLARPRPVGIGSPRASLEANFALKRLVGADRFFLGLSDAEHTLVERAAALLREGPSATPTLHDIEAADLVIVLGEDLTNTAPMLDFSVRRWARLRPTAAEERLGIARWNDAGVGAVKKEEPSALWIAATHAGKLDEIAAEAFHAAPDDLARFALALATALAPSGAKRALKGLAADDARPDRALRRGAARRRASGRDLGCELRQPGTARGGGRPGAGPAGPAAGRRRPARARRARGQHAGAHAARRRPPVRGLPPGLRGRRRSRPGDRERPLPPGAGRPGRGLPAGLRHGDRRRSREDEDHGRGRGGAAGRVVGRDAPARS